MLIHIHQKTIDSQVNKKNLFSDCWTTCDDDHMYGDEFHPPFRVPGIFDLTFTDGQKTYLRSPKKLLTSTNKDLSPNLISENSSFDPSLQGFYSLNFDARNPDNVAVLLERQNQQISMQYAKDCVTFFQIPSNDKIALLPVFEPYISPIDLSNVQSTYKATLDEVIKTYKATLDSSDFVDKLNAGEMQEYITWIHKKPINFISVSDDLPVMSVRAILDHGITMMKMLITKDDPLFIYFTSQRGNHLIYIETDGNRQNYTYVTYGEWLLQHHIDALFYILPGLRPGTFLDLSDNNWSNIQKVIYHSIPYSKSVMFSELLFANPLNKSDPNHYLMQHKYICYDFRLRYASLTTVEYRKQWSKRVQHAECFCHPNTPNYRETISQMYANQMRHEYRISTDALTLDYELALMSAFVRRCQNEPVVDQYWGRPRMILYFLYNYTKWTTLIQDYIPSGP